MLRNNPELAQLHESVSTRPLHPSFVAYVDDLPGALDNIFVPGGSIKSLVDSRPFSEDPETVVFKPPTESELRSAFSLTPGKFDISRTSVVIKPPVAPEDVKMIPALHEPAAKVAAAAAARVAEASRTGPRVISAMTVESKAPRPPRKRPTETVNRRGGANGNGAGGSNGTDEAARPTKRAKTN